MAAKNNEVTEAVKNHLHDYELIFVASPEVTEEALDSMIEGVQQFITGKNGSIEETSKWGKRRLAYPIRRFLEGNYVLTRFKMGPEWSKELEASLRISEQVLRYLLVRLDS
ncbi:30S ribosomal protein S6 [Chloroflexota bacterium]